MSNQVEATQRRAPPESRIWEKFVDNPPSLVEGGHGVVVPACAFCLVRLNTVGQFARHLTRDVLSRAVQAAIAKEKVAPRGPVYFVVNSA
ncbi:MAG: hypothetical protein ACREIC_20700 [Limisphaerales bacterium]